MVKKSPKVKRTFAMMSFRSKKCRNMVLTHQPRLYFTTTETEDGQEGRYLYDIILYSDLKVSVNKTKPNILNIFCPTSQITYELETEDASIWQ